MNILYDHQAFSSFAYGGVSRIYCELLNAYMKDPGIHFSLSLKYSDNVYLNNADWNTTVRPFLKRISLQGGIGMPHHLIKNFVVKRVNNYRKRENRKYSEKMIAEGSYDIFHPTYYDPYFLDLLQNKPFVLTVYDMIYELFPEYYPSTQKFLVGKSLLLQKAAKIIAISENTKKDLIKLYHLPDKKIEVIYLASSLKSETGAQDYNTEELKLPERYLLYVGNRALYKNFLFFAESILPLLSKDNTLSMICAGGKDFTQTEKLLFRTWGVEHRIHYVPVNDAILATLYTNALAFVFPSLYEGFGIPILEAFACNCPVLMSNTSSLPEIAGNACVSFDPKDKISIVDAVNQVLSDKSLREDLCKKGKERVKIFSWERTAKETKQLYENIH
jgi:glycosyltransferase involved in cell wall biosynthesis